MVVITFILAGLPFLQHHVLNRDRERDERNETNDDDHERSIVANIGRCANFQHGLLVGGG